MQLHQQKGMISLSPPTICNSARKSLSFSKSVELHDKVIGHYLNIKHYQ
ncbi:IS1 family transposase [Escherichia coli]